MDDECDAILDNNQNQSKYSIRNTNECDESEVIESDVEDIRNVGGSIFVLPMSIIKQDRFRSVSVFPPNQLTINSLSPKPCAKYISENKGSRIPLSNRNTTIHKRQKTIRTKKVKLTPSVRKILAKNSRNKPHQTSSVKSNTLVYLWIIIG